MERWLDKVAVVTGASSGIGVAVVKDLVKAGFIVVGLARRYDRITAIKDSLPSEQQLRLYAIKCDVSSEEEVKKAFAWVEKELGGTDVLINNAGVAHLDCFMVDADSSDKMRQIVNTNLMGVTYCTREAFNSMRKRNFNGHIILINSILGHKVWNFVAGGCPPTNIYSPTKFAVTALTETYRQEFLSCGTKVKITSISPGLTDTEIISDEMKTNTPLLKSEDISNAVLYVLSTPPNVQVHELTIKPLGEVL